MGTIEESVQALLVESLGATLTRRTAERIVADVRRNRAGVALPTDVDGLLAMVRGDLAKAAFLRVGSRAPLALSDLEERLLALDVVPLDAWSAPRVRLVLVGRSAEDACHLAREIGAHHVARVSELHELLIALDSDERTVVVVDTDALRGSLDAATLARFVPDFPSHVLTFVASSSPATREAYLSTGAAFRATLRTEPLDHPDVPQLLRDLVRGECRTKPRRTRGGSTSTTTGPARAA